MKRKKLLWFLPLAAVIIALVLWLGGRPNGNQKIFLEKADLLKEKVVTDETINAIGDVPVDSLGNVVFFSVCDGSHRAKTYTGKGKTLSAAWKDAVQQTSKGIKRDLPEDSSELKWVRVDVVSDTRDVTDDELLYEMSEVPSGFNFNGLALDPQFEAAMPEGVLNGRHIYDYKENNLNISLLNEWLEETGREPIEALPEDMIEFRCCGWFCDENNDTYTLCNWGADTGRRQGIVLDAEYARNIIDKASSYLVDQVTPEGKFIYGIYPQYDEEIDDYNILRHSGTIWSLVCRYRLFPDEKLKQTIESTIDYMLSQIKYDGEGTAYLYEEKDDEIKLGGNGISVVAMTEYMDVFQNDAYVDECVALGEGILKQQDSEDGSYYHILNSDFTVAEDFRTIYYDGECTFALLRLYELTGDQKWLDAACKAIDHFIDEDYTQYRDHWVAYSLNEVTKFVDRQDYYDFALANAVNNYSRIEGRRRTYPTNLELLISAFETWQRMVDKGLDTGNFDVQELLDVISGRTNRQLSGYFYPELAMYMQNPDRILDSFMMRNSRFRVRIDDVQHNIGGFYLYWKNYDAMLDAGLDPNLKDSSERGN